MLLLTTVPNVKQWQTHAELGEACRRAARQGNAGLADTEGAFWATGKDDPTSLFAWDGVHLSPVGHELVVRTILQAIEPRPSAE